MPPAMAHVAREILFCIDVNVRCITMPIRKAKTETLP